MFEIKHLVKYRTTPQGGRRAVLKNLSLTILKGALTCIIGASGSGKSTLLHLLNRMEEPDEGEIYYGGMAMVDLDVLDLRRKVGLLLQVPTMLPGTVRQNLEAGPRLRGQPLSYPVATELLEQVGLSATLLEQEGQSLSGGEKQRVALARLLANNPNVILMDEATASLDPAAAEGIERLVRSLMVERQLTCIWVSHEPAQVMRVADHVALLLDGDVALEGPPEEVLTGDHAAMHHYLSGRPQQQKAVNGQ